MERLIKILGAVGKIQHKNKQKPENNINHVFLKLATIPHVGILHKFKKLFLCSEKSNKSPKNFNFKRNMTRFKLIHKLCYLHIDSASPRQWGVRLNNPSSRGVGLILRQKECRIQASAIASNKFLGKTEINLQGVVNTQSRIYIIVQK